MRGQQHIDSMRVWVIDGPVANEVPSFDLDRVARIHGRDLYRRALRFTGDTQEAWDLLQGTYERALRSAPPALGETQVLAWLKIVMRNRYLDLFRARNRRPEIGLLDPDLVPSPDDDCDEPPVWSNLTIDEVRHCLTALTTPLRQVYELHALNGLSYAEISERLQVSVVTIGTRLLRARQKLREALARAQVSQAA